MPAFYILFIIVKTVPTAAVYSFSVLSHNEHESIQPRNRKNRGTYGRMFSDSPHIYICTHSVCLIIFFNIAEPLHSHRVILLVFNFKSVLNLRNRKPER